MILTTTRFREHPPFPSRWIFVFFIALMMSGATFGVASAAVIYSQPDASVVTSGGTIFDTQTFTLSTTTTIQSIAYYCAGSCYAFFEGSGGGMGDPDFENVSGTNPALVASTTYQVLPADTYHLTIRALSGTIYTAGDASGDPYALITDQPSAFLTQIISTTPVSGSTIATSSVSTVGATGYVATSDFGVSSYLQIRYVQQSNLQAAVANLNTLYTTIDIPITAAGFFSLSTSTPILSAGQYDVSTTIYSTGYLDNVFNGALDFFGLDQFATNGILAATTTQFYAVAPTAFDTLVDSQAAALDAFDSTASSTASLNNCASFNIAACLQYLLGLQPAPMASSINDLRTGLFEYVPFGYVTRFVTIMSGGATTTFPTLSYTAGSSSPLVLQQAGTLTFQPFTDANFAEVLAIRADDGSNKDIWDIIDPYIQMLVAFSVLGVILSDLIGMDFSSAHADADGWSDRQKWQLEGMQQQQRTNYPFGRGRVSYDKKGRH